MAASVSDGASLRRAAQNEAPEDRLEADGRVITRAAEMSKAEAEGELRYQARRRPARRPSLHSTAHTHSRFARPQSGFGNEFASEGLPGALRPAPDHAQGPLRLLPLLVRGDAAAIADVGDRMEQVLLDTGMAGADTALMAQEGFGTRIEHARLLTLNDLAAMMALQYEHAGLAPLWPLVETALLAPEQEHWLDAPPEPLARYANAEVRMALLDIDAWAEGGFAPSSADATRLPRAFDQFQIRQRQFAAVLEAHAIPVTFDHCPAGRDPRDVLRA